MAHGQPVLSSSHLPISELAKRHLFEPRTDVLANPVLVNSTVVEGVLDPSSRGWHSEHSFEALSYDPQAPLARDDLKCTLGMRMSSKGLGWEEDSIQYVKYPQGYTGWGVQILNQFSFNLKGIEENTDYICGAIYCSLCDYTICPALLRSLLEKWSPQTNTFLFNCGERTITLLDMFLMAGLPVAGDPYEEFIHPLRKLNPSLLLFPNFLFDLLDEWDTLSTQSEGNLVTFQAWCDHFYNNQADPPSFTSLRAERKYTAAYIALWLCSHVVVGVGPYIRPGCLVMASWIAVGRKISLAPPVLSSLYFSLRRISRHPVGPSYGRTPWPVHYIIGWVNLYLKKVFKGKLSGGRLPSPKKLHMQPAMINTMLRPPNVFSSEAAHDFLAHHKNIVLCPYASRNLTGADQLHRSYMISVRRGMLPWRFSFQGVDKCVAEPYHPDRVAFQFKLDQLVPYNPLKSLFTETGLR